MDKSPHPITTTLCNGGKKYLLPGNIIPHNWYKKLTNSNGSADAPLALILAEVVYWHRPKMVKNPITAKLSYINKFLGDAWQTSYEFFEKKFGFKREKLRRIFVKLERMGICFREFRTVKLRGQKYNNRLFIHLSADFLNSCLVDNSKTSTCEKNNTKDYTPSVSAMKKGGGSPRFGGDLYIKNKNNIKKDRSTNIASDEAKSGSNFIKNNLEFKNDSFDKNIEENSTARKDLRTSSENSATPKIPFPQVISRFSSKPKKLADFYPLSQEDSRELQNRSSREFSLNAMNEILLDMSKRRTEPLFHSKKGFMSYMAKAFAYEKRDAIKINNENFKIKTNLSADERKAEEVERFLTEIEYSPQVSPEWHFKKKLACVLERNKAYSLLKAYRSIAIEGSVAKLNLYRSVDLTPLDISLVLSQIKATHDRFENGSDVQIKKVEFILSKADRPDLAYNEEVELPNSLWGSIRHQLISVYGQAIDSHWFSKLEALVDEDKKTIELKASSGFLKDWVERNYEQAIYQIASTMGVRIKLFA